MGFVKPLNILADWIRGCVQNLRIDACMRYKWHWAHELGNVIKERVA